MIDTALHPARLTVFGWLGRRLLLPVIAAAPAVTAALLFVWAVRVLLASPLREIPTLVEMTLPETPFLAALATVLIAPSLLCFGIPAGYLVARLKLGFRTSLAALALIGGFGGPLAMAVVVPPQSVVVLLDPMFLATFAVAGAVTAAIWTWLNRDLFRRHNGA